ncbi:MAG: MFS transporter [Thermoflexales bacterium]|nr:MFS transporter [Thermoflexales bacterium]
MKAAVLGAAHAASDGAAGLLIGHFATNTPAAELGGLVLIYNVLAFAAQPPIGLWLDRVRRPRAAVVLSLVLMALALLMANQPLLAVMLAGCASAIFHVSGGTLALSATPDRATGPGIFAAPGVIGLTCGGALAATGHFVPAVFLALLIVSGLGVAVMSRSISKVQSSPKTPGFEEQELIIVAVLAAIALRSALWSAFEAVLRGDLVWLLAAALAAGTGKISGGVLADRLGWRRWTIGSLAVAAPLMLIGPTNGGVFLIGLALLQSATPVTLAAVARMLPARPGLASGLSLGLAIVVGGLFVLSGFGSMITSPLIMLSLMALSGGLLAWALPRRKVEAP